MSQEGSPVATDCFVEAGDWPPLEALNALVERAVAVAGREVGHDLPGTELSVVFTDDEHMRALNREWRGKDKPTNVLSFPSNHAGPGPVVLGDIVIARETFLREAVEGDKTSDDHLVHLVVHGFLHLLGYDHETEKDAEIMEELERRVLANLAIGDPYA